MNDWLAEYVRSGSSEAFGRIVRASSDAVYSQSLRQLRDPSLAEEVTQQVFVTLARKAPRISNRVVLAGWFFNATRLQCAAVRRAEFRRRKHEQMAMRIREQTEQGNPDCDLESQAQPMLNDAIAGLRERDRNAIILKYFHGQSMRELGTAMGISEDAAKQRVSRAVEKLRNWFAGRGVAVESATLAMWLGEAVKPAPAHLVSSIAAMHLPKSAGMVWGWLGSKVAASVMLGTITVAAAAVGVKEIAKKPVASEAAPVMADDGAAATSQPVNRYNQATPIDALKKLSLAIHQDDRAAINACITGDGGDPELDAVLRAQFQMNAAWCHVQRASSAAFKTNGVPFKNLSFTLFPFLNGGYEALIDAVVAQATPPPVKTEGDIASVKITLPPEKFGGTGPNRVQAHERWSGAMLVLKKVGGDWKLDTTRTINMVAHNDLEDKKADPMKADLQLTNMLSDALEDGAGQIESGQLATSASAGEAMERSLIDAFKACHINSMSFMDLPVVSGP